MILNRRLDVDACCPADFERDALSHEFKAQISKGAGESRAVLYETADLPFYCQRIVAGAEHLG
jgi:hypothetical protein